MNLAVRSIIGVAVCVWIQAAWCAEAIPGTYEECIEDPIFDGKVCTVQANREAKVGVILIHGLGGSVDDWKNTVPALATDFHVLTFDLPGFGKSGKGNQVYSPTRYAKLAHLLADRYFQNKTYYIVGHSMGGAIALRLASLRPERYKRLVLIDAAGVLHPLVLSKFSAGSLLESKSGVQQTRGFAERLSAKVLEQVDRLPITPIDIANSALGRELVLQGGPEKIAALELAGEDFSSAIPAVTEPTLIIWGDNDQTVPQRTGKVLAARMPHARLEIISESGHVPMEDQPEELNALVRKQLLASDEALAQQYKQAPPRPAFSSERVGTCSRESDKVFKGDYRSIELRDCSNITIRDARVGQLKVINSRLSLIDTDIMGKDEGLYADNSDVTITNGEISGVIAIKSAQSRFDVAGVLLKGSKDAVKGVDSKFVFSISRATSPHTDGPLHTYKNMVDEVL